MNMPNDLSMAVNGANERMFFESTDDLLAAIELERRRSRHAESEVRFACNVLERYQSRMDGVASDYCASESRSHRIDSVRICATDRSLG